MLSTKKLLYKILQKLDKPIVKDSKSGCQITWASTSNPFCEHSFDVSKAGYTPIAVSFWATGTLSSAIMVSACCLNGNTVQFNARLSQTPSSTTQNKVTFVVTYAKSDLL